MTKRVAVATAEYETSYVSKFRDEGEKQEREVTKAHIEGLLDNCEQMSTNKQEVLSGLDNWFQDINAKGDELSIDVDTVGEGVDGKGLLKVHEDTTAQTATSLGSIKKIFANMKVTFDDQVAQLATSSNASREGMELARQKQKELEELNAQYQKQMENLEMSIRASKARTDSDHTESAKNDAMWREAVIEFEDRIAFLEKKCAREEQKNRQNEIQSRTAGMEFEMANKAAAGDAEENAKLKREIAELKEKVAQLTTAVSRKQIRIEELEEAARRAGSGDDMKNKLAIAQARQGLLEEIERLKKDAERQRKELEALLAKQSAEFSREMEKFTAAADQQNANSKDSQAEVADAADRLGKAQDLLKQAQAEVKELRAKVKQLEAAAEDSHKDDELAENRKRIKELEGLFAQAEKEKKMAEKRAEDAEHRAATAAKLAESAQQDAQQFAAKNNNNDELLALRDQIEKMQGALENQKFQYDSLLEDYEALKKKHAAVLDSHASELQKVKSENEALLQQLQKTEEPGVAESLRAELESLRAAQETAQKKMQDQHASQMAAVKQEAADHKASSASAEASAAATAAAEQNQGAVVDMTDKLASAGEAVTDLTDKLAAAEEKIVELTETTEEQAEIMIDYENQIRELESEVLHAHAAQAEAKAECQALSEANQKLEAEVAAVPSPPDPTESESEPTECEKCAGYETRVAELEGLLTAAQGTTAEAAEQHQANEAARLALEGDPAQALQQEKADAAAAAAAAAASAAAASQSLSAKEMAAEAAAAIALAEDNLEEAKKEHAQAEVVMAEALAAALASVEEVELKLTEAVVAKDRAVVEVAEQREVILRLQIQLNDLRTNGGDTQKQRTPEEQTVDAIEKAVEVSAKAVEAAASAEEAADKAIEMAVAVAAEMERTETTASTAKAVEGKLVEKKEELADIELQIHDSEDELEQVQERLRECRRQLALAEKELGESNDARDGLQGIADKHKALEARILAEQLDERKQRNILRDECHLLKSKLHDQISENQLLIRKAKELQVTVNTIENDLQDLAEGEHEVAASDIHDVLVKLHHTQNLHRATVVQKVQERRATTKTLDIARRQTMMNEVERGRSPSPELRQDRRITTKVVKFHKHEAQVQKLVDTGEAEEVEEQKVDLLHESTDIKDLASDMVGKKARRRTRVMFADMEEAKKEHDHIVSTITHLNAELAHPVEEDAERAAVEQLVIKGQIESQVEQMEDVAKKVQQAKAIMTSVLAEMSLSGELGTAMLFCDEASGEAFREEAMAAHRLIEGLSDNLTKDSTELDIPLPNSIELSDLDQLAQCFSFDDWVNDHEPQPQQASTAERRGSGWRAVRKNSISLQHAWTSETGHFETSQSHNLEVLAGSLAEATNEINNVTHELTDSGTQRDSLLQREKDLRKQIEDMTSRMYQADISSLSLAQATVLEKLEEAFEEQAEMEEKGLRRPSVEIAIARYTTEQGALEEALSKWGVNACVEVLEEVRQHIGRLEYEIAAAPHLEHEVKAQLTALKDQAKVLKIEIDHQGGWEAALNLDGGEIDTDIHLGVWEQEEKVAILTRIKDNLVEKLAETVKEATTSRTKLRDLLLSERASNSRLKTLLEEALANQGSGEKLSDVQATERAQALAMNVEAQNVLFEVNVLFAEAAARRSAIERAVAAQGQNDFTPPQIEIKALAYPLSENPGYSVNEVIAARHVREGSDGSTATSQAERETATMLSRAADQVNDALVKQHSPACLEESAVPHLQAAVSSLAQTRKLMASLAPKDPQTANLETLVDSLMDVQHTLLRDAATIGRKMKGTPKEIIDRIQTALSDVNQENSQLRQMQKQQEDHRRHFGMLEQAEDGVLADKGLVSVKASLVLHKMVVMKELAGIQAQLTADVDPSSSLYTALQHVKKKSTLKLQNVTLQLENIHKTREANLKKLIELFGRVNHICQVIFGGRNYMPMVQYHRDITKKAELAQQSPSLTRLPNMGKFNEQGIDAERSPQQLGSSSDQSWFAHAHSFAAHSFAPQYHQVLPEDLGHFDNDVDLLKRVAADGAGVVERAHRPQSATELRRTGESARRISTSMGTMTPGRYGRVPLDDNVFCFAPNVLTSALYVAMAGGCRTKGCRH
jgi:chromosome segregation ATPase